MYANAQSVHVNVAEGEHEPADGFHLAIDALKLDGMTTIQGVPGIPITDFGRMAQAAGIRVISFKHEQNAGNAAGIADDGAGHRVCPQSARIAVHETKRFAVNIGPLRTNMCLEPNQTMYK